MMYMVYYKYTHEPYVFVGAHVHMYTHNMCINIDMVYDVYGVL